MTTSVYSTSEIDKKFDEVNTRLKALETTTPIPPTVPIPPVPPTVPPVTPTGDYLMTVNGSTISSKNVKSGAVTMATDANSLLQKNVDAGGITSVGPGTFPMISHILISKPASIIGSGDATIFKPTVKTNLFLVEGKEAANVELAQFQIAGLKQAAHSGAYAVRLRGSGVRGAKVHDLYIHDFDGYGVILDSPFPSSGIPSDITLFNLRLFDNDEVALGLMGRNITATNIKTRTTSAEIAQIAIELDHPHNIMDNITVDGFEVDGGKRSVFMGGRSVLLASTLKDITIKHGTISNSPYKGLNLDLGAWQNVVIDDVTMYKYVLGLFTRMPGVKYSNMKFGTGALANGTPMVSEGGNLP